MPAIFSGRCSLSRQSLKMCHWHIFLTLRSIPICFFKNDLSFAALTSHESTDRNEPANFAFGRWCKNCEHKSAAFFGNKKSNPKLDNFWLSCYREYNRRFSKYAILQHTQKKKRDCQRHSLFFLGADGGTWTHTISHLPLKQACLPFHHIRLCNVFTALI